MVQSAGFDPTFSAFGSADERRPSDREPDSARITPATETETASPDSRRRLETPESAPAPNRIAFTAKFGPDADGFPLQLIRGEQVTAADTIDPRGIAENRVSQESRTALLQAQESRDAVAQETERQQEAASESRAASDETPRARPDPEPRETDETRRTSGSFLDLQI